MSENKVNFYVIFVVELFKDVIDMDQIWITYVKSIQVCTFKYGSNIEIRRGAWTWHEQENTLRW